MIGLAETQFDLKFRLLDVPVRIHPLFWAVSAILGWRENNLPVVLLWVLCVFVSILVHEYGHALMSRAFGCSPSIVLWSMGGLCYSQGERQTPKERLAVVLAGPGAGFVLLGAVILVTTLLFRISPLGHMQAAVFNYRRSRDEDRPDSRGRHGGSICVGCVSIPCLHQPLLGIAESAADLAAGRGAGDPDSAFALRSPPRPALEPHRVTSGRRSACGCGVSGHEGRFSDGVFRLLCVRQLPGAADAPPSSLDGAVSRRRVVEKVETGAPCAGRARRKKESPRLWVGGCVIDSMV